MEKKNYETPELRCLGTVRELTAATAPPVCGSALEDFASQDAICVIQEP